jgi:hypothetical protein
MHVHLPKPLHGWRAFVGEVGIIVLGVLIALAAQQFVEDVQWKHDVEFERKALRSEARDMLGAIAERGLQQDCVDRRLKDIATLLESHASGQPIQVVGQVGRPTRVSATRGSWPIALAGQTLLHMPQEEQLAYSSAFGSFDVWDRAIEYEYQDWLRLRQLDRPDLMTETDWANVRQAYFAAVELNDRMRELGPYYLRSIPELIHVQISRQDLAEGIASDRKMPICMRC